MPEMSDQELAKLEGLAIGLDVRGEKFAAQQVRWAQAEIERLNKENDIMRRHFNLHPQMPLGDDLRVENERLKGIEELYKTGTEYWNPVYQTVLKERDELRTLADTRDLMLGQLRAQFDDMVRQRDVAEAEVERLKAEKLELAKHIDGCVRVAAEALTKVKQLEAI
jgi:hypothetical protein